MSDDDYDAYDEDGNESGSDQNNVICIFNRRIN